MRDGNNENCIPFVMYALFSLGLEPACGSAYQCFCRPKGNLLS